MLKKLFSIVLCLTIALSTAYAQNQTINGKVVYADDNSPVIGASVVVVGTRISTSTDVNGAFTLQNVPANANVKVELAGMKTWEGKATPNMQIKLETETEQLETVVFTGYRTQSSRSFTGALAKVSGEAIEKKSDANFVKSLEGNVTGVQMNNSTGQPGTWGAIFVRGRGSLNSGTQPLYVIDGVPVNSDEDGMSSVNNHQDPMAALNPNDIENVTVLKDAAATAIYGARAANGVIVINTKRGQAGRFNINLDIKQGIASMANHNMKYANAEESMQLFAMGRVAAGLNSTIEAARASLTTTYGWDGVTDTDWMDIVSRNGYYQDYNLSVSGQVATTSYYVSMGYLKQEGIIIASDFARYSGRANLSSKFKMFTFGLNASYAATDKNGGSQSTGGSFTNPQVAAVSSMLPFYKPYDAEGNYTTYNYMPLAVWDKKLGDISRPRTTTINLVPNLRVDFGYGIYAKTTLGVNVYNLREYQYWSAIYNNQGKDYNGLGQQYNSQTKNITWTNLLGWNKIFNNRHDISLLFGQEMQKKDYYYEYYSGEDFPFASSGMRDLATVGTWGDSEYYTSKARLASYFFDAQYSLDYKYYLSGSFRRDGSSVFGADKRWGNFWSVGAKWRFSAEEFLKNNVLTDGTLRVSYGTVGNQDIGWYASRGFYTAGSNYNSVPGMTPGSMSNRVLTWEASNKLDVGLDLAFINRINLKLDFYRDVTTDALFSMPLSMVTGLASTQRNIGEISNTGLEVELSANIISNENVRLSAWANTTYNKNKVLKLSTDDPIEGTRTIVEVGRPYSQFKMIEYAGVDTETGKPLFYKNETGDETTTKISEATKRYQGSAMPKFFGGFGANFEWKGLDASFAFNYRLGVQVYDGGARFTGWGMTVRTPLKEMIGNTWTPENKNAKYPQYVTSDPNSAAANTHSRFLYDGSFLRLNNVTIGYTLPKNITQKAKIERLRLYVTGDNLYTFTAKEFFGYTPETYSDGYIAWQYPQSKSFVFGVQITF